MAVNFTQAVTERRGPGVLDQELECVMPLQHVISALAAAALFNADPVQSTGFDYWTANNYRDVVPLPMGRVTILEVAA